MNMRAIVFGFYISLVTMLAFSAPSVAWFDDFNDGDCDDWEVESAGGEWEVKDGELHFDGGGNSVIYAGDPDWTDYTFEADVKLLVSKDYIGGIRARIDPDSGACYSIWLYPDQQRFRLIDFSGWPSDGGWAEIGDKQPSWDAPPLEEFHKLKLVFEGDHIDAYWDDELMCSAKSDTREKGCFGINGYDTPVVWDNVWVYGPGIPVSPGEPGYVVEAKSKLAMTWGYIKSY